MLGAGADVLVCFLAEKETLCKHPRRKASLQCICVSCVSQAGIRKACRTGSSPETLAQSSEVDGLSQLPQGRIWEAGSNLKIGIGSGAKPAGVRGGPLVSGGGREAGPHVFSTVIGGDKALWAPLGGNAGSLQRPRHRGLLAPSGGEDVWMLRGSCRRNAGCL